MMLFARSITRLSVVVLLSGAFTVALASRADAQQIALQAVNATLTVADDGSAQATFSIKVTNSEESPMTGFLVTYSDGSTAPIADVPAHGAVVSDPQNAVLDLSQSQSASVPVSVTLTYTLNGSPVTVQSGITLTRS
jgi:hypothetical protein